jgi:subtilase family serine protease
VKHVTRLRAIAAAGTASLLTMGAVGAATAPASAGVTPAPQAIAGSSPSWATPGNLASKTPVTTGTVSARIYLASRDAAGLAAFAMAASTPGTGAYRHFLTPAQAQARFGPAAAEADAVRAWAAGNGLTATGSAPGFGGYVGISGPAATVARAFNTTFGSYRLNGKIVRAPEHPAYVPAAIAADVQAVSGLDTGSHVAATDDTLSAGSTSPAGSAAPIRKSLAADSTDPTGNPLPPPGQDFPTAQPCSSFYGQLTATTAPGTGMAIPTVDGAAQSWSVCGYTPAQLRGAYHVTTSGETGKGVTVALIGAYVAPTMPGDANQYAAAVGEPGFNAGHGSFTQIPLGGSIANPWTDATACDAPAWYTDETVTTEAIHAMAPDANVTWVGAASCSDADLAAALSFIVNHHTASIVSNSWHDLTPQVTIQGVFTGILQAAAAEGIGVLYATGGMGYHSPNYQSPGFSQADSDAFPASDPFATAVGGTSLAIGPTDNYESETAWGDVVDPLIVPATGPASFMFSPPPTPDEIMSNYAGSGGGGVSAVFQQPDYQAGIVPAKLATTEVVTSPPAGPGDPFTEQVVSSPTPMRVTPDVSAIADPATGFLNGETLFGPDPTKPPRFFLSRIAGVGLATAVFAGIEADAEQGLGGPIGFANPLIYSLDRANARNHAFHDVVEIPDVFQVRSGFSNPNDPASPVTTRLIIQGINGTGPSALIPAGGYDDATGVGSPASYIQAVKVLGLAMRGLRRR